MDKREKIFSKINIKDYTSQLEKILEKKDFSIDTKNLLLSMLYKIENAYTDYTKAKVEVPSKYEFVEDLFTRIQHCREIIVAKFNSEASDVLEKQGVSYIINKEEKKIIVYGNDLLVYECILELSQKESCLPSEQELFAKPICNLLKQGYIINKAEVIRDFNGWSWDIVTKEIPDLSINLIYQTFNSLLGYSFLENWVNNDNQLIDYLQLANSKLQENFEIDVSNHLLELFLLLTIEIASKQEDVRQNFMEKITKAQEELSLLNNKNEFLEKITKEKKEYTKQIEEIDKILNNKELLKQEYMKRNEQLPNKEKIFSISHLANQINEEREDILDQIKQCNELIEPRGFVKRKNEIEQHVLFLQKISFEQQNFRQQLLDFCTTYLKCFETKVEKAQTKSEILNLIYQLRYYKAIPFEEDITVGKIEKLEETFTKIQKALLSKAIQIGILEDVTKEETINYQVLYQIFNSKMIDFANLVIEIRVEEQKLYADYYDTNVLESTQEIFCNKTVQLKKKIKFKE